MKMKNKYIYLSMRKTGEIPEDNWFMIEFPKNWRSHSSGNFSAMPPSAIWVPEGIKVTWHAIGG